MVNLDLAVEDLLERLQRRQDLRRRQGRPGRCEHFFKDRQPVDAARAGAARGGREPRPRRRRGARRRGDGAARRRGAAGRVMVCMSSYPPRAADAAPRAARAWPAGSTPTGSWSTSRRPSEAPDRIDAEAQRHLLANIETRARARRRGGAPARPTIRSPRCSTSRARTASATSSSAARTQPPGGGSCSAARCRCGWSRRRTASTFYIVSIDEDGRADASDPAREALLAQAPLARSRCVAHRRSLSARVTSATLGRSAASILKDNYRSVLAAQRMKEALERIDSARDVRRRRASGRAGGAGRPEHRRASSSELAVQERNITERGEPEATAELRRAWNDYRAAYDRFVAGDRPRGAGGELLHRR